MLVSIHSINLQDYYMIPYRLHQNRTELGLTVSLVLRDISLQERQERAGTGHPRSDVVSVSGSSGRSGNRFGRVILGEF